MAFKTRSSDLVLLSVSIVVVGKMLLGHYKVCSNGNCSSPCKNNGLNILRDAAELGSDMYFIGMVSYNFRNP